jgi:copper homeostasis protein CutC
MVPVVTAHSSQKLMNSLMETFCSFPAIDMASDIGVALEAVISLGCERVLTSGGENTVLEGAPVIRRLNDQAGGRIIVMSGEHTGTVHPG